MTQPTTTPTTSATLPRNGFGVTALVLGIVGVVLSWVPVLGGILAVLAVVFGGLGYARARQGQATNQGMTIAGLVLGVIAFVIQVIVFAAVGSAANQLDKELNSASATPLVPNAVAPAPVAPAGPLTTVPSGTYTIGTAPGEVVPGTYRTAGSTVSSLPCYWAREKDTSGEFDSIIANGTPTGSTTVTIKASDGAFETMGCEAWTKVS
jgi:hypothetical protein